MIDRTVIKTITLQISCTCNFPYPKMTKTNQTTSNETTHTPSSTYPFLPLDSTSNYHSRPQLCDRAGLILLLLPLIQTLECLLGRHTTTFEQDSLNELSIRLSTPRIIILCCRYYLWLRRRR